jgi:hypothetical protein
VGHKGEREVLVEPATSLSFFVATRPKFQESTPTGNAKVNKLVRQKMADVTGDLQSVKEKVILVSPLQSLLDSYTLLFHGS